MHLSWYESQKGTKSHHSQWPHWKYTFQPFNNPLSSTFHVHHEAWWPSCDSNVLAVHLQQVFEGILGENEPRSQQKTSRSADICRINALDMVGQSKHIQTVLAHESVEANRWLCADARPCTGVWVFWIIHINSFIIWGGGVHQWGYPEMDGLWWDIPLKWMI